MPASKGTNFFVQWSLGILSSLCVASIIALGRTVLSHEIDLAVLKEKCGKDGKLAAAAPSAHQQPIRASFGPQAPPAKPHGEPRVRP